MAMEKNLLSFPPEVKSRAISFSFIKSIKSTASLGLMDEVILLLVFKSCLWNILKVIDKVIHRIENGNTVLGICFPIILVKSFPVLFYIVLKMILCPYMMMTIIFFEFR